ncbi:armadillo-like helical domain-containing protein 3 [Xenia sp. Carnegie-2017]|uniref:armadillo-like helical domain-containing protein 3 n=1 Tax=Xenia sp. Carnegie-2017 TaxID=2897299 RepID=UPI001F03BDED|nr:armadillo-like helical domain-containing protein 3 [Xenia sp. Carnegie-2017]
MFATVASAASLSSQDLSKFTSGQSVRPARHVTIPEKDTKMNQTTVSIPTSPNRLKPKEKLIGFYDSLLQGHDPGVSNFNFWHEFFLLKVNAEYLEGLIEKMTPGELMAVKANINLLFAQCCVALQDDYLLKMVNALQTLCTLVRGIYNKKMTDCGFDIINLLVGFDEAESEMKALIENINAIVVGESPVSLKNLSLKLLLILLTATDNVSQNTIVEYLMINSVFESIVKILASPVGRQQQGYEAIMLLTLLVNYRKYEASNPYIVKLSILDDDVALNGLGCVISDVLTEFNRKYREKTEQPSGGILSNITSMVGSIFLSEQTHTLDIGVNSMVLLALYEAVHLNRHFFTVLSHITTPNMHSVTPPLSPTSPIPVVDRPTQIHIHDESAGQETSNLLVTFLTYTSIVLVNIRGDEGAGHAKLCFIILTCIAEDQYANAFLHDINITFSVPLYKVHMHHRTGYDDRSSPSRPLACALLDLIVEFLVGHMTKNLQTDLYSKAFGIIHRILCYQKRCRVRLSYSWNCLWTAMMNFLKFLLMNETTLLPKVNIFQLGSKVVSIFNLFITYGDTFLPSPSCYDELYYEIIRVHQIFDNLYSMALRHSSSANANDSKHNKQSANRLAGSLVNIRAIIHHFSPKVDSWAAVNHLSSLTSEQVLDVIRGNYDTLTLKLQENLDNYEKYVEKPKESSFFTQLVRSITADVRKSIAVTNLKQFTLLQEFSSIR